MPYKFIPPEQSGMQLGTAATAVSPVGFDKYPAPFEDWLKENVRGYPVTLDLPPVILVQVGTIVTYWALVEWIQAGTVARLLGISRKEARVMFGPRIGNSTSKIKQLMEIKSIQVPEELEKLSALLNKCETARNLVGHCVWMQDETTRELCLQNPSGEWTPPKQPKVSKRKYPEAFYPDQAWFSGVLEEIKKAIWELQALDRILDSRLPPSPRIDE